MTRGIYIPGIQRTVSIGAYCAAICKAKANPDARFPHTLNNWWSGTGADILREWREVRNVRITAALPISHDGAFQS
jgi:hypothetical protein